jgi:hypothetical protein
VIKISSDKLQKEVRNLGSLSVIVGFVGLMTRDYLDVGTSIAFLCAGTLLIFLGAIKRED